MYQFQPINASIRCITVFVEPSTTGKASAREVSRLWGLKERLGSFNLTVVGFAFDGDSTYTKMHSCFFHGYSKNVSHNVSFEYDAVETPLMISDPLHLLKRARYRLVSKNIDVGMSGEERPINVSRMKELFDLPAKTWSNSLYTKMHDDLAVRMFSLENFVRLVEARLTNEVAYFMPNVLLNTALREADLQQGERIALLEVGLLYMLCYEAMVQNTKTPLKR